MCKHTCLVDQPVGGISGICCMVGGRDSNIQATKALREIRLAQLGLHSALPVLPLMRLDGLREEPLNCRHTVANWHREQLKLLASVGHHGELAATATRGDGTCKSFHLQIHLKICAGSKFLRDLCCGCSFASPLRRRGTLKIKGGEIY